MSVKFDDFLQEQLQDPEFKKEYEAIQSQRAIIDVRMLSDAEMDSDCFQGMTFSMRDENGFTPAEAKELKRRITDIEAR